MNVLEVTGVYLGSQVTKTKKGVPLTFVNLFCGDRPMKIGVVGDIEVQGEIGKIVKVTVSRPSGTLWASPDGFSVALSKG